MSFRILRRSAHTLSLSRIKWGGSRYFVPLADVHKKADSRISLYEPLAGPDLEARRAVDASRVAAAVARRPAAFEATLDAVDRSPKEITTDAAMSALSAFSSSSENRREAILKIYSHMSSSAPSEVPNALQVAVEGLARCWALDDLKELFAREVSQGTTISDGAMGAFIRALIVNCDVQEARRAYAHCEGLSNVQSGPATATALLELAGALRDRAGVEKYLKRCRELGCVGLGVHLRVVDAMIRSGKPEVATSVFTYVDSAVADGTLEPTSSTFAEVLRTIAKAVRSPHRHPWYNSSLCEVLLGKTFRRVGLWAPDDEEYQANVASRVSWTSKHNMEYTTELFDSIMALAVALRLDTDALEIHSLLAQLELSPSSDTFVSLLEVAGRSKVGQARSDNEDVLALFEDMKLLSIPMTVRHYTALVRGYGLARRHWHVDNLVIDTIDRGIGWGSLTPFDPDHVEFVNELLFALGYCQMSGQLHQLRRAHLPEGFMGPFWDHSDIHARPVMPEMHRNGVPSCWMNFVHACLLSNVVKPPAIHEMRQRKIPMNWEFYWGLRWIAWDGAGKWSISDGSNSTWSMAQQLAEKDGFRWWDF